MNGVGIPSCGWTYQKDIPRCSAWSRALYGRMTLRIKQDLLKSDDHFHERASLPTYFNNVGEALFGSRAGRWQRPSGCNLVL